MSAPQFSVHFPKWVWEGDMKGLRTRLTVLPGNLSSGETVPSVASLGPNCQDLVPAPEAGVGPGAPLSPSQ